MQNFDEPLQSPMKPMSATGSSIDSDDDPPQAPEHTALAAEFTEVCVDYFAGIEPGVDRQGWIDDHLLFSLLSGVTRRNSFTHSDWHVQAMHILQWAQEVRAGGINRPKIQKIELTFIETIASIAEEVVAGCSKNGTVPDSTWRKL